MNENTVLLESLGREQLNHATQISNLTNKVDDLEHGISRILFLLENDARTGSKGIVEQVRENTVFREAIKTKVTTLGIVGGVISTAVMWIIKTIIK